MGQNCSTGGQTVEVPHQGRSDGEKLISAFQAPAVDTESRGLLDGRKSVIPWDREDAPRRLAGYAFTAPRSARPSTSWCRHFGRPSAWFGTAASIF